MTTWNDPPEERDPCASGHRPRKSQEPSASHGEPRAYATVISVPHFADAGVQRPHARMKDPGPEPEANLSDAGIEAG